MRITLVLVLKSKISHFFNLALYLTYIFNHLNCSVLIVECHSWGKSSQTHADDVCNFVGVNNKFGLEKNPG